MRIPFSSFFVCDIYGKISWQNNLRVFIIITALKHWIHVDLRMNKASRCSCRTFGWKKKKVQWVCQLFCFKDILPPILYSFSIIAIMSCLVIIFSYSSSNQLLMFTLFVLILFISINFFNFFLPSHPCDSSHSDLSSAVFSFVLSASVQSQRETKKQVTTPKTVRITFLLAIGVWY